MNVRIASLAASLLLYAIPRPTQAQTRREDIYAPSTLYQQRTSLEKDLRTRITGANMRLALDSDTEDKYMSACWAVSQFLIHTADVENGLDSLYIHYPELSYDTKKALLEATYAISVKQFSTRVAAVLDAEDDPKLFAMAAVYLFRNDTSINNGNTLKIRMVEKFPGYDTLPLLQELADYLTYHAAYMSRKPPDLATLFSYNRAAKQKSIYSFQRHSRDYPGLAVIQDENGRFLRDAQGKLLVFRQLARSGSDLPYFITNGSTPQGIYSIQGTDVSRIRFIGPTPNIQLQLPFEGSWEKYFHIDTLRAPSMRAFASSIVSPEDTPVDSLQSYLNLLPPGWRKYTPMLEAWSAGKIGRTEIIAHGTTIDPEFFKDKPFYPLTPTMGCLCARELWNPTTGHPLVSEQLDLVNAWRSTPGRNGYLYVIDIDNQGSPVSRSEIEAWVP